jgi:diphosphomevalonate decarboxylase
MMQKKITWRCPSNIALVKYWGKKEHQIPCNASLSLTLNRSYTEVSLTLGEKKERGIELQYFFHGQPNEHFQKRILHYLEQNQHSFDFLKDYSLTIHSNNSFPHSAGIASSASSFGAIALALLSVSEIQSEHFYKEASCLARLGSGSACRSMYGPYALWGSLPDLPESSDDYAVPVPKIHPNFQDMCDAIIIVDDSVKKVSSSAGHALMKGHPYADRRFLQANQHCKELLNVLAQGEYEHFITIIEKEALALHAMMMTSDQYFLLMKPGTIHVIEKIMEFRKETGITVAFTLDAGPNVHVLYPGKDKLQVMAFLESVLKSSAKEIIYDNAGTGPVKISG